MSSKYLSGTYASGYTLTGTYTTITIGLTGSIGGTSINLPAVVLRPAHSVRNVSSHLTGEI